LSLAPSEATLGVGLALQMHLVSTPSQQPQMEPLSFPLEALSIFDEESAPLGTDSLNWQGAEQVSLEDLVRTTIQLTRAFRSSEETEVLVQALAIVELLIRRHPGILSPSRVRPILLAAFVISAKLNFDEVHVGVIQALQGVGFDAISLEHLTELEIKLLQAIYWQLPFARQTYTQYTFELRALVSSCTAPLMESLPELANVIWRLDDPPTDIDAETQPRPRINENHGRMAQTPPPMWTASAGRSSVRGWCTPTTKTSPSSLARRGLDHHANRS